MHSVLFVGEADDGPTGRETIVDWSDNTSIAKALHTYGESIYEPHYLEPSSTGCTLVYTPWSPDASFVYFDNNYKSVQLPDLELSTSGFSFTSPPLIEAVSGWIVYRKFPTNRDVTWALRRASEQNVLTPSLYETCGLLRVVSADAVRATIDIGPLTFTAVSPGQKSNNIQLLLGSSGITIVPPPGISLVSSTYLFTQSGKEKSSSDFKSIGQLIEAIQQDSIADMIPITAVTYDKSTLHLDCWSYGTSSSGVYNLSGGDNGTDVTVDDIFTALSTVDVSNYEVVAFCGRYGREVFPYVEDNLLDIDRGFPYQIVCSSSGSNLDLPYASKDDSFDDRWQSSRFCLVNGTLEYGTLLSASGDLIPNYSVILTSHDSWHGFGSRAPFSGRLIAENTEKRDLASVGVVTLDLNRNIPVVYKGCTTDTEISSIGIACLRGVCRGLFPTLYDSIGINTSEVLPLASNLLEESLIAAKKNGCPIIDYQGQALIMGQTLVLNITLDIAGQVEAISAQVAVPLSR